MPMIVKEQMSPEWWTEHLDRITGGTAAGCLGGSPDMAPISAFKKIKQLVKEKSNWYTEYGVRFEASARAAYERYTGRLVWETGFWIHPQYRWLGSSPDGLCFPGLVELKCPQKIPTAVPWQHMIQAMVAMAVCDQPWCDYFCWHPHLKPFICRIVRDLDAEKLMIMQLEAFWKKHIELNVPPPRRKHVPKKEMACVPSYAAAATP